jgi:hypothetical protein
MKKKIKYNIKNEPVKPPYTNRNRYCTSCGRLFATKDARDFHIKTMGHMLIHYHKGRLNIKDKEIEDLKLMHQQEINRVTMTFNEEIKEINDKNDLSNYQELDSIKETLQINKLKLQDNIKYTKLISESINKITGLRDNSLQDIIRQIQTSIDNVNKCDNYYWFVNRYNISPFQYQSKLNELEIRSIVETNISKRLNNENAGELIYQFLKKYLNEIH